MANDEVSTEIATENCQKIKDVKKIIDMEHEPPSKKLKQGRLPFKPLDHAGQISQGNTPPGSKKRKLSDNDSPSAKQLRTSAAVLPSPKPLLADGEHEVSSSSEADNLGENTLMISGQKVSTIDKFFRRKPIQSEQEITSSNQCIEIDLTDDVSDDSKPESNDGVTNVKAVLDKSEESTRKTVNKKDIQSAKSKSTKNKLNDSVNVIEIDSSEQDCEREKVNEVDSLEVSKVGSLEVSKVGSPEMSEVGSKEVSEVGSQDEKDSEEDEVEVSFIENTSICEDALKTPAKEKGLESVLKTPVVAGASSSSVTTPGQCQGSTSDGTPISGKKKSKPLSESKQKEREAQRQKVKEQKEKEKEERRLAKEREKEEKKKELAEKKRQKEEQLKKEKAEKETQKQDEKDKRERERQEKLKQKEEEKKSKEKELEAKKEDKRKKDEEKRLKDEERKQKEEEKVKEEEEKQRKAEKKASMFKGFFIKKETAVSPPKPKESKNGLFMPFELKPNMRLAPQYRREPLSDQHKHTLDDLFNKQSSDDSFLKTVKVADFVPRKCGKTWPKKQDEDDDVELLSHEKETIEKVTHHVKFLYFHENTRPAYYGTWRKKSAKLSARNPFKQDEELFDYEVDSDDEWEEEEPGESVSSDENEDGDEEKVEEEDADGDDWMVPHGYLSDGEGVEDEEEVDTASKQDLQRVRQAAWESELKRQAKPLKMLAIGCAWQDDDTTTIAAQQLEKLLKYKAVCLIEGPIGTSFSGILDNGPDSSSDKTDEKTGHKSQLKKSVPEEAIPDLIRLLHGNPIGMRKLVKEFRMFWQKKINPSSEEASNTTLDSSKLDMSMDVDEKAENKDVSAMDTSVSKSLNESKADSKDDFIISIRQLEIKIPLIATREKRSEHKKICWYVHDAVLKQFEMEDLKLPNSWQYVCIKEPTWAQEKTVTPKVEEATAKTPAAGKTVNSLATIKQFALPMSPSQIQALGAVVNPVKEVDGNAEKSEEAAVEATTVPEESQSEKTETPVKPVDPDQRSIKDMFSPVARKSLNIVKKSASPKVALKAALTTESVIRKVSSPSTKSAMTVGKIDGPKNKPATPSTSKSGQASVNTSDNKMMTPSKSAGSSETKNSPGLRFLKSMVSSPELMKTSPKQQKISREADNCEEPMDVDIIVLD